MENLNPYTPSQIADPSHVPLRPQNKFGSILRVGWALYTDNLPAVAMVTPVVWIPLELLQAYVDYFVLDPDDLRSSIRLQRFLDGVFGIIAVGGVTAIGAAAMRGERIAWWKGLQEGLLNWPRVFWTRLLFGFAIFFALLALVLPAIYFGVRLLLIDQVAVIERESGVDGIKRSYELTAGSFWRLLVLWIVTTTALLLFAMVIELPVILFPEVDHWLLSAATSVIVQIFRSLQTLVFVAAYFAAVPPLSDSSPPPSDPANVVPTK